MARKVRIKYAGAFYHVLNRGNYRDWIFESEGARKKNVPWLGEGNQRILSSLISRYKSTNVRSDESWKLLKNQEYVD